ncbi:MAG: hypothetical protein ACTSWL_03775 [Promethearchaeota archaeon]
MKKQDIFYFKGLSGFKKIGVVILIYQIFISGLFGIYLLQTNNHIQENCVLENSSFDDAIYFYSNELSLNEENSYKINNSINSIKQIESNPFFYFDLNLKNTSNDETIRFISLPKSLGDLKKEYSSIFNFDPNISLDEIKNFKYFSFQKEGTGLKTVQDFNFLGQIATYENISINGTMFQVIHPDQKLNVSKIFKTINCPHFFHISDNIKYIFVNQVEFWQIMKTTSLKTNGLSLLSLKTEEMNFFSFKLFEKLFTAPSTQLYSPNREIGYYFLFQKGIHSNFDESFYKIRDQINITFQTLVFSLSVLFIFYFIKTMNEIFQKNMDFFKKIVIFGDGGIIRGKLIRDIYFKVILSIFPFLILSDVASMFYFSIPRFSLQASFLNLLNLILLKDIIILLIILLLNIYLIFIFKLKSRLFFLKNETQQIYSLNVPQFKIKPYVILLLLLGMCLFNYIIMDINHAYYINNKEYSKILEDFISCILPYLSSFLLSIFFSILFFRNFQDVINKLSYNLTVKLGKYSDSEKIITNYWLKRRKLTHFNLFYIILIISSFSFIGYINYQELFFITGESSYPAKFYPEYANIIQIFGYLVFVLLIGEYLIKEKHLFQNEIIMKYSDFGADIKRLGRIKTHIETSKSIITQIILILLCLVIVFIQMFTISNKYFTSISFFSMIFSSNLFFLKTFMIFLTILLIIILFYKKTNKNKRNVILCNIE